LVVSLVAFVLGFFGSMPLAGPIALMVVSRCAEGRHGDARRLAYGAAVAEAFYAFLAFWGFFTFLARHEAALPISHAVTAIVLFLVGIHFVRWKKDKKGDKTSDRDGGSQFFLGLSVSMLNPTLLVTWSAVATALYSRQLVLMEAFMALPFGAAAGAGVATWYVLLVAVLARFANRFPERTVTWAIRSMGLLLVALAVWSGVDFVRRLVRL
jgi:threonine/homoserine/homoserine lactone efflux protein